MKKISLYFTVALTMVFVACKPKPDPATEAAKKQQEQQNILAMNEIMNSFATGDVGAIKEYVADDYVDHTEQGDKVGIDSLISQVRILYDMVSDYKSEIIQQAANGDYVFSWMRYSGNNVAPGMPPGPFTMQSLEVARFKNGKAVEHWAFIEARDVMKMMPAMEGNK